MYTKLLTYDTVWCTIVYVNKKGSYKGVAQKVN